MQRKTIEKIIVSKMNEWLETIKTINDNFGVIVKKGHCFEVTVSETQSSLYYADWIERSEILGNIFDNPNLISELLKSEGKK